MTSPGGARVFVRLYDGATRREGDGELLMLPPAPLAWKAVVAMMIMAVTKQDDEPDEQTVARARLFLLPADSQTGGGGIVAELNARSLRFGVRDNDQFAICLNGEEYERPSAATTGAEVMPSPTHANNASSYASMPAPVSVTKLSDHTEAAPTGPPRGGIFSGSSMGGPPSGGILSGMTGGGMSRKAGNKRVRSISGKMAAIKSLGDKGLITAEDRGHLKDLLLNNDSPALQEALDNYQNTGDFQAVKALLMKELQNPSSKRGTSDWLPEGLINDISKNFQTYDDEDDAGSSDQHAQQTDGYERYAAAAQHAPQQSAANPFMYHNMQTSSTNQQTANLGSPVASDYTNSTEEPVHATSHVNGVYDQRSSQSSMSWSAAAPVQPTSGGVYAQSMQHGMAMQSSPSNMYGGSAQINLPLRNRNSVNLMLKQRGMDGSPVNGHMMHAPEMAGYGAPTPTAYGMGQYAQMGYGQADYSRMSMSPYGMVQQQTPMGMAYSPYQQQQQQAYGMSAYGYGSMGAGMQGYDYYGGAYGYAKNQMGRPGGKWTTAPPMPSYPPPCSKEEKKEKIARWLKKRENRNWSNKPSYPVRHNIAKNRKRGEDGRFITKARLAEMALEEAARGGGGSAAGDNDGSGSDDNSETGSSLHGLLDGHAFASLPPATAVHM